MKSVSVRFSDANGVFSDKLYEYFCDINNVYVDDLVVVCSPHGYKVCKVASVDSVASSKATKHIICKVDLAAYEARIKAQEERVRVVDALEALDQRRIQMQRFEMLANTSEEAKQLVEKLKSL